MAIVWRDKLLAFGVHFAATALLAAAAATLVFGVWYPAPFHEISGGSRLFELVVGCDLALGPLISHVIFNRAKARRALVFDYAIVAIVQVAALAYGVWVMASSRPVYVAFLKDRFEVVMAQDMRAADLAEASDPRDARLPWFGPELVSVKVPAAEREAVMFEELAGHGPQMRPRFFVPYEAELEQIRKRGGALADLEKKHPEAKQLLAAAVEDAQIPPERLRWLPVAARLGFYTALVDFETGKPVSYALFDPY
jgi:hypothetical protein